MEVTLQKCIGAQDDYVNDQKKFLHRLRVLRDFHGDLRILNMQMGMEYIHVRTYFVNY